MKKRYPLTLFILAFAFLLARPSLAEFRQQGEKLVGTGAIGVAQRGTSVSLSADGSTAIVGGNLDEGGAGAAWIMANVDGVWTQQGPKLVGADVVGKAQQGLSVSISADGNTAIVGGPLDNDGLGAAWIWTRNAGVWTQEGPKLAGRVGVGSRHGRSVAISADGNTVIVGGSVDGSLSGGATVWTRRGGVWTQQGLDLTVPGADPNEQLGTSVSLSADGNTAIVGGVLGAWVWTRSGGVWTQQGSRLTGTGTEERYGIKAGQGRSVSLSADGNTAIVGGPFDGPTNPDVDYPESGGAAWIWTRTAGVWTQQGPKLVGSGAVRHPQQGWSVTLSPDGDTAVVGGNYDDRHDPPTGNRMHTGAVWIWSRSGGVWTQQAPKLVASGTKGFASQGASVSLSADGNTLLVGGNTDGVAFGISGSLIGAAWVWTKIGGVWTQSSKLVGTGAGDGVGQGVAVSLSADGNTAIVGGWRDNGDIGAVWVWTRTGEGWSQQTKLVPSDSFGITSFGFSVALSADGRTAIIGGPAAYEDSLVQDYPVGGAWVFTRSGDVWTQQSPKLVGTDGFGSDQQGHSVALSADGNTAIVGAFGGNKLWVWIRRAGVWTQGAMLFVGDEDGYSVALSADGSTAIVGTSKGDSNSAYVFTRSGEVWTRQGSKLAGSTLSSTGGPSVALSADGNTALVGEWLGDDFLGAARVWTRSGGVWTQQGPKLTVSDTSGLYSGFGQSVSLSADGNTAIIGAPYDGVSSTNESHIGAAWIFTRNNGVWYQQSSKRVGSGATGSAGQGDSVALSGDGKTAIVGGPGDRNGAGAAWVFEREPAVTRQHAARP